nr:hypothetical protein [Tanacetum cinerariifolium]
ADVVGHEGGGGATAAGVQYGHVAEQLADELLRGSFITAVFQGVTPGRKVGVAAVARSLRVRYDHFNAILDQVRPVFQGFRVAFADDEHGG